jgi:hypothetical protein
MKKVERTPKPDPGYFGILVPPTPLLAENVAKCYGISIEEAIAYGYKRKPHPKDMLLPDHDLQAPATGRGEKT